MGSPLTETQRGRRRFSRSARLAGLGALVALVASGCGVASNEFTRLGQPEPASDHAVKMLQLWQGSWIAAFAVGILVWGLIIIAIVAYRRSKRPGLPVQTRYNLPIEILYTAAPLVIVMVLFVFTTRDQVEIEKVSNNQEVTVNVVGFRWNWTFNYVNEDVYEVGTPAALPLLVLPVNQKVQFRLTSPDVNHSFWIPAFLYKEDLIPGRENIFEVTPTREGTYAGKCAELCGVDHSRMLFNVEVVSEQEYEAYIQKLRDEGQTGQLASGQIDLTGDSQ